MAVALIVAYVILTWIFGCLGIALTMNRKCHIACVVTYGSLMFFILAIPLLVEGTALKALHDVDSEDYKENCAKTIDEIDDDHNSFVVNFFEFAHRFDKMSETVLDTYMCTKTCPCLEYEDNFKNSKTLYMNLNETILNSRNRTNTNKEGMEPLYFTQNKEEAYKNFNECYEFWRL